MSVDDGTCDNEDRRRAWVRCKVHRVDKLFVVGSVSDWKASSQLFKENESCVVDVLVYLSLCDEKGNLADLG